jgi:lambda family phage minor tail protein L
VTTVTQVLQSLEPDTKVELFSLNGAAFGAGIYYFTTTPSDTAIVFNGVSYPFVAVKTSGWEWNGRGTLPRPKVEAAGMNTVLRQMVRQYGDLVGAIVTRTRTFARFLDTGTEPDPTAVLPQDIFRIEQKTQDTGDLIEWELSAYLDQQGDQLPARVVLRDTCLHTYRKWNGSAFVYTNVTCPYVGGSYFQADNASTGSAALDVCGKRVSSCKLRFGANNPLPGRFFPGVARARGA